MNDLKSGGGEALSTESGESVIFYGCGDCLRVTISECSGTYFLDVNALARCLVYLG